MNDVKLSGDELIAAERERQVLDHNHTIVNDARAYKQDELIQMAAALIYANANIAPDCFDRGQVMNMINKGRTERMIYAGAFLCAQIDVDNLIRQIDESMKSVTDGNETEDANEMQD
jgi:hypothetical protein